MQKCKLCHGCLDFARIGSEKLLHCWLCDKYYRFTGNQLIDVTQEVKEYLQNETKGNVETS